MYLKEVALENFKSFGRKTCVNFQEGFTAITGPNGSGKSNIGDAILFVLGPKSSKAIRAGRLTDLIYNGGKNRHPSRFCKVSLVFDNSDRLIPLDADDVRLTRLVKRSSTNPDGYYSYFYINDRKSTLTEFDELLSHAHISADGYNLVQQGDITRIVEMGGIDRRRVLDGIAGITKYDEGLDRASQKRKETEDNMEKLGIILEELKIRTVELEVERTAALRYRALSERRDVALKQSAYKRKESFETELAAVLGQIEDYRVAQEELEKSSEEVKEKVQEAIKCLDEVEREIADKGGNEARELKEKIDKMRVEIALLGEAAETAEETIAAIKSEKALLKADMKRIEKDVGTNTEQMERLEKVHAEKRTQLDDAETALSEKQDTAGKSGEDIRRIQRDILMLKELSEKKVDKIHEKTLEKERHQDRVERHNLEMEELEESKKISDFEVKDVDFELKDLNSATRDSAKNKNSIQEEYDTALERQATLYTESCELETAIKRLTRDYNRLKAQAAAAEYVTQNYNRAVNSVMEARDKGEIKGIIGTIAELAEVKEKYENALTVASGNRMQAIIVENDEVAAKAMRHLKKHKAGRATFLPLNKMSSGRPGGRALMAIRDPAAVGFAIDLIKFDSKYKAAFWYALKDTIIVSDLNSARKLMGGVRLVTLDGELCEASGAMVGGSGIKTNLKFGAPSEGDMEKTSNELRGATEHADIVTSELQTVRGQVISLEAKLREASGDDDSVEMKIKTLDAKRKEYQQKSKAVSFEIDKLKESLLTCASEIEAAAEAIDKTGMELNSVDEERERLRKKLHDATPQRLAEEMKTLESLIHALTTETLTLKSEADTTKARLALLNERKNELDAKAASLDISEKSNEDKIKTKRSEKAALESELVALYKIEKSIDDEMRGLQDKRDNTYKLKTDLEAMLEGIKTKIITHADIVVGLDAKIATIREKIAEASESLGDYVPEDISKVPSLGHLKRTISDCEAEIVKLGNVNMRAIDEYDQKQARFTDISDEVARLDEQKKHLEKLIKELDEKKKVGLMRVFDGVNENFNMIFSELSVGGTAELILDNPESPFEGGLTIKARPRGKKVLRLDALSGGEKSLTALAFIFAIQQHNPSPFYLLDEVDMFLDAVNAEYVGRMVKKNSKAAQTVMVSLRKVTLKSADAIYGVSMEASGVSRLVGTVQVNDIQEEERKSEDAATAGDDGPVIIEVEHPDDDGGDAVPEPVDVLEDGGGLHA